MNFIDNLEKVSYRFKLLLGFTLIGVVSLLDFVTGSEFSFSIFYTVPIVFITWFLGRSLGIVASLVSMLVWFWADTSLDRFYSHPLIPFWNSCIRLFFFTIITLFLVKLRIQLEREKQLATLDSLTGAANSRLFFNVLGIEIERLRRYKRPFTLAYIDIDNFKSLNDTQGHFIGDQALCTVVSCAKKCMRKADIIARLGGDEFALLLPETNQDSAQTALAKLQSRLLEAMAQNNWSITFSIGIVTCITAPPTVEDLVRIADNLMYTVKHESKNALKYTTYNG